MTHLDTDTVERYQQRVLSPPELLAVDDHLDECQNCRLLLDPDQEASVALVLEEGAEGGLFHLSREQLAAHLDGELDDIDGEIAVAHLDQCEQCAAELADLRAFKAEMSTHPRMQYAPVQREAGSNWLSSLWQLPVLRWSLATGLTALAVGGIWLGTRGLGSDGNLSGSTATSPGPGLTRIALNDGGGQIVLDAEGTLTGLPELPTDLQESVTIALRSGRLETPAVLDDLRPPAGQAEVAAFAVTGPVATVIRQEQPVFTWDLPAGAVGCKLHLVSADEEFNLETKLLTEDEWEPKKPLQRGRSYHWQVIAFGEGGEELARAPTEEGVARFQVIAADRLRRVEELEEASGQSHLARGVLYARAGLLVEAEREFESLLEANAGSAEADRLLDAVRQLRGGAITTARSSFRLTPGA